MKPLPKVSAPEAPATDAQTQRLAAHSMLQILQSKRGVSPETLDKGLASIASNIARVLAITRKLGDFSRVGADAPAPVAIDTAMESALALLRYSEQGPAHCPELEVTYRGAPGASVLARAGQLEQVIFNILLNAAQAMRGRGRVEADAVIHQGDLTLSIRDTGPGIAAEHLARVFDPFFTTKPPGEGTGLGLAISYEIAHELGGAMRAANREEGGALFETTLPLWRG